MGRARKLSCMRVIVLELPVASAGIVLVVAVTHCCPFEAVAQVLTDRLLFLVF